MKKPTKKQKLEWLTHCLESLVADSWYPTKDGVFTCNIMGYFSLEARVWYERTCAKVLGEELTVTHFFFGENKCLGMNQARHLWLEMLYTLVKANEL